MNHMTAPGCGVTVLRALPGRHAAKQWIWSPTARCWRKIDYDLGGRFRTTEYPVANLAELGGVLERVRRDPRAVVVRGALRSDAADALAANPNHTIRRLKHAKANAPASLGEVARRWIMIDIDHWHMPAWADLADDPESVIEAAIGDVLPPAFQDAECFWQLSSSAGFTADVLKAHLFFWLAEPASNATIKSSLKEHAPEIDLALFNAAQLHYVADPIIEGGPDPLPRRTGWRRGLDVAVVLPTPSPRLLQPRPGTGGGASRRGGSLAEMGDGPGLSGFHAPIRDEIMRYARDCARLGGRDDPAFKERLRAAIRAAPAGPNPE